MSSSCGSQALQVSGVWLKILLRGQITLYVLLQLNGRQLYYCLRLRVVVEYLLAGVLLSSVVDVTLSTLLFMFHLISFSLHVIVHVSSYFLRCLDLSVGVLFHGASGWGWVLPRYLLPKSASYLKFSVTCDATYIYQVYK